MYLSYLTVARYVHRTVSVLVVAQPSSEVPEGLMNYPVLPEIRILQTVSRSVIFIVVVTIINLTYNGYSPVAVIS